MTPKLYFTAGEPSGDLFAAEVIDALKFKQPEIVFRAIGSKELAKRCDGPDIDTRPLNVLGFWEGIKAYGDVRRISTAIANDIVDHKPDAVVLVDSWGLSLRIATRVRAADPSIRLIKLIGPQVWASRAGRAKTLANSVDHLLCMHTFEVPYYKAFTLPVTVIGQPALARRERLDGSAFRTRYGIARQQELLLVLPGSRKAEIERVADPLIDAARKLSSERRGLRVCVAPAKDVMDIFLARFDKLPDDWIVLADDTQRYEAMAAATLALSCSGTVNTELAVQQTPFITGYKIGRISWLLLSSIFFKAKFITLLNMAANKMVAPEFLQNEMTPETLVKQARRLLDDANARQDQLFGQETALATMGFGGRSAQDISAEAILRDLKVLKDSQP